MKLFKSNKKIDPNLEKIISKIHKLLDEEKYSFINYCHKNYCYVGEEANIKYTISGDVLFFEIEIEVLSEKESFTVPFFYNKKIKELIKKIKLKSELNDSKKKDKLIQKITTEIEENKITL
jgi:hypothetical protein